MNVRADQVDVEQIMRQIRMRIREKRGADYTEDEIRELANVRLERFLDPGKVRSGLLDEFRLRRQGPAPLENFEFEDSTIYASHRAPILVRIRRLLAPVLKLFFNVNPMIRALHLQSKLNRWFIEKEQLDYEVMSNLVLETTRLSIEVKNLRMRLESVSARLDFDEHRARALEGVVQYKSGALAGDGGADTDDGAEEDAGESDTQARAVKRRRRRRTRRRAGLSIASEGTGSEREPAGDRSDVSGNVVPPATGASYAPPSTPALDSGATTPPHAEGAPPERTES